MTLVNEFDKKLVTYWMLVFLHSFNLVITCFDVVTDW